MPYELIRVPFGIRKRYAHMQPGDVALWERWIQHNIDLIAEVAYDVHVGSLPDLPPNMPAYLLRVAEALYPLKIDAVLIAPNTTLVFEIKPRASLNAIGQALCYQLLLRKEHPELPPSRATILTDTAHHDTPWLCKRLGINLLELDKMERNSSKQPPPPPSP